MDNMEKQKLITLENGLTGFFDPSHTITKSNDASGTERQLFNVVDPKTGNITERSFYDPNGHFTNVVSPEHINDFIKDPDTFNRANPSGFDPKTFDVLQKFRDNPQGLADYTSSHPEFKIWKQETKR